MLNVSVVLPTYGEYIVENKGAVSKDAHGVRAKIDKCRTYAKQRMSRADAIKYYNEKLRRCFDAGSKNCT